MQYGPNQTLLIATLAVDVWYRNGLETLNSETAYHIILKRLKLSPNSDLVDNSYDEENFGNFFISFKDRERHMSVICDRDELVICSDLLGTKDCKTAFSSLLNLNEDLLLKAIGL